MCCRPANISGMSGTAPNWAIYAVATLAASVFVHCLWTGKVGMRGSREVVRRAANPALYWALMLVLASMVFYLVKESFARLPS
jgi:hypothetical protein